VTAVIEAAAVPLLPGARELVEAGQVPGGTRKNLRYVEAVTDFATSVPEELRLLLADAQTSGGLLLTVPPEAEASLVRRLIDAGARAARIGSVEPRSDGPAIRVL
jgi:selenide,water dikinase